MSTELVTISIGSRTVRVPLDRFLRIVQGDETLDCKSAFIKVRLAATAKRSAMGFCGDRYWLGIETHRNRPRHAAAK